MVDATSYSRYPLRIYRDGVHTACSKQTRQMFEGSQYSDRKQEGGEWGLGEGSRVTGRVSLMPDEHSGVLFHMSVNIYLSE